MEIQPGGDAERVVHSMSFPGGWVSWMKKFLGLIVSIGNSKIKHGITWNGMQ